VYGGNVNIVSAVNGTSGRKSENLTLEKAKAENSGSARKGGNGAGVSAWRIEGNVA
jgi:hypothetical protein